MKHTLTCIVGAFAGAALCYLLAQPRHITAATPPRDANAGITTVGLSVAVAVLRDGGLVVDMRASGSPYRIPGAVKGARDEIVQIAARHFRHHAGSSRVVVVGSLGDAVASEKALSGNPAVEQLFYLPKWLAENRTPRILDTDVNQMSVQQLHRMLAKPAPPLLVDVQPDLDYAVGRLPGHVHVDAHRTLMAGDYRPLPDKNQPIVLYCLTGQVSQSAAAHLIRAGYREVYNLDGGVMEWEAAGYPLDNSRVESEAMS